VKALILLLAVLLVLRHPAGVAVVLAVEASVCAGLGWLMWRGLRAAMLPPAWRRTV
jgi:hypothetical protein